MACRATGPAQLYSVLTVSSTYQRRQAEQTVSQTQIPFKHRCGLKRQVMRKTATGMREERGAEADRQREENWGRRGEERD